LIAITFLMLCSSIERGEIVPEGLVPILEGAATTPIAAPAKTNWLYLPVRWRSPCTFVTGTAARVDAARHHRLVVPGRGNRHERLQRRERPQARRRAQQMTPVELARQKIAAAGAASVCRVSWVISAPDG
jgi:hypothetical protein